MNFDLVYVIRFCTNWSASALSRACEATKSVKAYGRPVLEKNYRTAMVMAPLPLPQKQKPLPLKSGTPGLRRTETDS